MCAPNFENRHFLILTSNLTYIFEKPTYTDFEVFISRWILNHLFIAAYFLQFFVHILLHLLTFNKLNFYVVLNAHFFSNIKLSLVHLKSI